jgi:hypothetical protein
MRPLGRQHLPLRLPTSHSGRYCCACLPTATQPRAPSHHAHALGRPLRPHHNPRLAGHCVVVVILRAFVEKGLQLCITRDVYRGKPRRAGSWPTPRSHCIVDRPLLAPLPAAPSHLVLCRQHRARHRVPLHNLFGRAAGLAALVVAAWAGAALDQLFAIPARRARAVQGAAGPAWARALHGSWRRRAVPCCQRPRLGLGSRPARAGRRSAPLRALTCAIASHRRSPGSACQACSSAESVATGIHAGSTGVDAPGTGGERAHKVSDRVSGPPAQGPPLLPARLTE